jgi:hypothetical protein
MAVAARNGTKQEPTIAACFDVNKGVTPFEG